MFSRRRRRPRRSTALGRFTDCSLAAAGVFCLYVAGSGLLSGEIRVFSKYLEKTILLADDPVLFSATVIAWISGSAALLRTFLAARREW